MKGVSCTRGGHNGDQLVHMCPAISEDVLHSPMSKNNSNNDAAADHINNTKVDRGTFPGPCGTRGKSWAAGLGGGLRGSSGSLPSRGPRSLSKDQRFEKKPGWESQEAWVPRAGFTPHAGNSPLLRGSVSPSATQSCKCSWWDWLAESLWTLLTWSLWGSRAGCKAEHSVYEVRRGRPHCWASSALGAINL